MSLILGLIIIGCSVMFVFSLRLYRQALKANPGKVIELERELMELRLVMQNKKTDSATAAAPVAQTVAPQAAPAPNTVAPTASEDDLSIRFLPASMKISHSASSVPIVLTEMRARWIGSKNLRIQFNIQYTKGDGGNQQGRILIVARGQSQIFVYPEGSISNEATRSLIGEESGEHFSVSRFRGVLAQFGPFTAAKDILAVDVFIMNDSGELLIHKTLSPKEIKGAGSSKTNAESEDESE
ncbi:MAG: hypothetical protein KA715_13215 [Xanthomonadaceae bacterium]|nr:hypothetical protein [Xanthomonadaceae bacterium]